MALNNGGPSPWGNPRPGGPWGTPPPNPPGGGGRGQGPDLDDLIRQAQDAVRKVIPSGGSGGRGLAILALIVVALWAASGFYRVQPDEEGVVLRFGAFDRTAAPGLNYHIPWPVETVETPRVTTENLVFIGFRSGDAAPVRGPAARDVLEESLMLTGDENIIDIDFVVRWRIRDAGDFLFNTRNPEVTIKSAAESMMREVIGRTPIQPALTEARGQIEDQVRAGTQAIMDQYRAGIAITQVQLQKVDPPGAVIEAFRDVQRAAADRERQRNEAEAYRNDIIPRARGEAERMVQEAQGYRDSQEARARGEAARFTSVLSAYSTAPDVTRRRLYLETMEEILRRNPKVVVDDRLQGLVPLLNLGDTARPAPRAQAPAAAAATQTGPRLGAGR
ncbi:FtsH protease activity modulator HflK [Paracraurococcus ruber]|uniref:Protein HflK n=1 Tax=Paracraurococcus ruber TaxID=77675 RepID=A0ABS1CW04_9PROT|nr:FtsH protease activity modulator HflK [Paracraurococcus ruber]MBK1658709.1 FtsH protease activity modulator HflK [Paracraurococcus ruber]TDG30054.1 FtsH protease activity modulator HflK [Paracraurococcus ruber]